MIYDDDSKRSRYGYVRNIDVPLSKDDNGTVKSEDTGGVLKVAGDFAIFAVGTLVGGAMLRGTGRSIGYTIDGIAKTAEASDSIWMKKAAKTFAGLKTEAVWLDDTMRTIEGGTGRHINYFETLSDSEKFTATGLNKDYLKQLTVSRVASYARRAAYELPASYLTQRYVIERERTKREIEEGRFNPMNPIDTIGDFAIRSAELVAGDIALHSISPLAKTYDQFLTKNSVSYAANKSALMMSSEYTIQSLKRFSENIGMATRAGSKTLNDVTKNIDLSSNAVLDHLGRAFSRKTDGSRSIGSRLISEAKSLGKEYASNLELERREGSLYGNALRPAATAHLGTSLKSISGLSSRGYGSQYAETVYGEYTDLVQSNLVSMGVDADVAKNLVDANIGNFLRNDIVDVIHQNATGVVHQGQLRTLKTTQGDWAKSMELKLGAEGVDHVVEVFGIPDASFADAAKYLLERASIAPDPMDANRIIKSAEAYVKNQQKIVAKEFARKQGRSNLDLREIYSVKERRGAVQREDMAFEVFETLGIDVMGSSAMKNQDLWGLLKQHVQVDDLETRTKALLVSRGKAYDTTLGRFNVFGMSRVGAAHMVYLDKQRHKRLVGDATASHSTNASMFGSDRMNALAGFATMRDELGATAVRRMQGERGVYSTISGNIIDTRSMLDAPRRALRWIAAETKIPLLGFNPLNLFGISSWIDDIGLDIRFEKARGGFFERKKHQNLSSSPLFKVGKNVYGKNTSGDIQSIGAWSWFRRGENMVTSIAKKQTGQREELDREVSESRGFFGGRWFLQDKHGNQRGKIPSTVGSVIQKLDFEQDAVRSIPHKVARRLNRSGSIWSRFSKAREASKGPGGVPFFSAFFSNETVSNQKFLPTWFDSVVRRGTAGKSIKETATDHTGWRMLRSKLDRSWSPESAQDLARILEERGISGHYDSSDPDSVLVLIRDVDALLDSGQATGSSFDTIKRYRRQLDDSLKLSEGQQIDKARLSASVGLGPTSSKNARVNHLVRQNVSNIHLALMRATDPDEFDNIWNVVKQYRDQGLISESSFQGIRSTLASIDLRISESAARMNPTIKDSWMRAPDASKTIARLQEVMTYAFGPGAGRSSARDVYESAGKGFRGAGRLFSTTVGNKGWRSATSSIIDERPRDNDPFVGSKWIGLPSFTSALGIDRAVSGMTGVLSGQFTYDELDHDTNPMRAIGSIFFGDATKGTATTGTLAGTHLITRIAESTETLGLGMKYSSSTTPASLMGNLMLKRALPVYGAILGIDVVSGIPGLGKDGIMGLGATVVGPGLGLARASVFSVTGLDRVFDTFSEVTNQEEDAFSRTLGRDISEEYEYWTQGEVPIRQGRWWTLGNTRFKGGKINYYRPNWWRMYMSDYKYDDTSDKDGASGTSLRGSRLEHLMFGTDISPLRMLDPYHYEKKHYDTRPYPVSGDYFTGPWGPLNPILNATVGTILKPRKLMHQEDMNLAFTVAGSSGDLYAESYQSGRMNIGPVRTVSSMNQTVRSTISGINERLAARGNPLSITKAIMGSSTESSQKVIEQSSGTHYSESIVSALNKTQTDTVRRPKIGTLGGQYSSGDGYIPAEHLYILSRQPYTDYAEDIPLMSQSMKPGFANYRTGEMAYLTQEWAGFYGFMSGTANEIFGGTRDRSPQSPVLQASDRMTGLERSFWDLDLGGLGDLTISEQNVQISEIVRRFIPHRRRDIQEVNYIPNTSMPSWMPGSNDIFNYHIGDPFLNVKMGEARLPGAGYEAINTLHPDESGAYGVFDRFKILADIAPWSSEYNTYKKVLEKSDLTDELRSEVTEIKRQVAQKRKKIPVSEYMWNGDLQKIESSQIHMNDYDPNLFHVDGVSSPIRMAGVRFSKTEEGMKQARAFYDAHLKDRKVDIYVDKNQNLVNDNREKTIDAILKTGFSNVNKKALAEVRDGNILGSESPAKAYIGNMVRHSPGWQTFGKTWEKLAHTEIPFISMKFGRMSSDEYFERRMVYGKQWQSWEDPVNSFLKPTFDLYTRDRGPLSLITGSVLTGWFTGAFFEGKKQKTIGRIGGGIVGAAAVGYNQITGAIRGQRNVPRRRKKEWAVDEYVDILNYVKYSRLYSQARMQAIKTEGVDPEACLSFGEAAVTGN
jgi:hypothetical protein